MTTYKRMDVVMAEDHSLSKKKVHLGLIDKDFNEGDLWVKATAKDSPRSSQFMVPGWPPERIRPATEADIANAPDFAQAWVEEKLLDHHDPKVCTKTRKGARSIRDAGINRISDLARFTDKELLALDGIGKGAVKEWREQAFQQMQKEAS